MSYRKVLGVIKAILLAVIPIIREKTKVEDSVIVILEIVIVILGIIVAF